MTDFVITDEKMLLSKNPRIDSIQMALFLPIFSYTTPHNCFNDYILLIFHFLSNNDHIPEKNILLVNNISLMNKVILKYFR